MVSARGSDRPAQAGNAASSSVSSLQPPVVPSATYDEAYFRHACAGHEVWTASGGARADALYAGSLELAGLRPGQRVVDLGCGRGELLAVAVARGAKRAIGVEYSAAAVSLARQTLVAHGTDDRAQVIAADIRRLPLEDSSADLVTMLDVVEHLSPQELHSTLSQARRILVPGGRIFIHTMPNRLIYDVTYALQRRLYPGRARRWPADPRNDYERRMHVNEQTRRSLRQALRHSGFRSERVTLGRWVYTAFVPDERARRLYHHLAAHRLTSSLAIADIWARAQRGA